MNRLFGHRGKVSILSETGNIFLKYFETAGTTLQLAVCGIGPNLLTFTH